jgi:hypothetical protein
MHALLCTIPGSLEVFKFTRQWIKVDMVEVLGVLMQRLLCLRVLDLSENYINAADCKFITSSISSKVVRELALGFNHIKSEQLTEDDHLGLDRFSSFAMNLFSRTWERRVNGWIGLRS